MSAVAITGLLHDVGIASAVIDVAVDTAPYPTPFKAVTRYL